MDKLATGSVPYSKLTEQIDPKLMKYFERDFTILNYVGYKFIEKTLWSEMGITTYTKLCTNYVIDMDETINTTFQLFAIYEPNPYGMVVRLPGNPMYKRKREKKMRKRFYIYDLGYIDQPFWEIKNINREKISNPNQTLLKPKMKTDEFKKILTGELPIEINGKNCSFNIDDQVISDIDSITDIYRIFTNPVELNILASHRDLDKSNRCLDYVGNSWARELNNLFDLLEIHSSSENIFSSLINLVKACEQMGIKIHFIQEDFIKVHQKLLKLNDELPEQNRTKAILKTLLKKIEDNGPILKNKEKYIKSILPTYQHYLTFECELTNAIIEIVIQKYPDLEIPIKKLLQEGNIFIETPNFGIPSKRIEIQRDIKEIRHIFSRELSKDPRYKYKKSEIYFNYGDYVQDGRDELWK